MVKVRISCGLVVAMSVALWSFGTDSEVLGQVSSGGFLPKPPPPTMSQSISSGFRRGLDAIGSFVSPKPPSKSPSKPPADPTSLNTDAKPSPELYVAFARLHHQNGRLAEASQHYQKALSLSPNHMSALLGYARVNEDMGNPEVAMQLYRAAAKAHPNKAPVFNNLGLSCAKRGLLDEALGAMGRAVQLDPKNAKYRNNMATLLVDAGRNRDAYAHLRAVHDHATCLYNLGCLLKQRGKPEEAVRHFTAALQSNPSFAPAQRELRELAAVARSTQPLRQPSGQANMAIRNDPAQITLRNPRPKRPSDAESEIPRLHTQPRQRPPWPADVSSGQSPERVQTGRVSPAEGPWRRQPAPAYGSRPEQSESVPPRAARHSVIVAPPDPNRLKRLPPVAPIRGMITDIAPMPGGGPPSLEEKAPVPTAPLPPSRQAPRPY